MEHEGDQCLRFIPGEILSVRRRRESSDAVGSRRELGQVTGSVILAGAGEREGDQIVLERIAVPPGLELRYLGLHGRDPSVLVTSLHYLGQVSAGASTSTATPVRGVAAIQWLHSDKKDELAQAPAPVYDPKLCGPVIVAVDCKEEHCRDVLGTVRKAWETYNDNNETLEVIGVFRDVRASTFGLYEFIETFAQLRHLAVCPDAVVLSVDFGLSCLRDPTSEAITGGHAFNGAASIAAYSFPVAEQAMRLILDECQKRRASSARMASRPALFAAAGNRQGSGKLRVRLAYPALLADTIAVTHVTHPAAGESPEPNRWADLPLAHDLKPVFALDESVAQARGADVKGTSFAAPWAAAWFVSLRRRHGNLAMDDCWSLPLSRMALLQHTCERIQISSGKGLQRVAQTPASRIPELLSASGPTRDKGLIDLVAGALMSLNLKYPCLEFAMTGSAAALIALASNRARKLYVSSAAGDIDLIYFGSAPDETTRRNIRIDVAILLKPYFLLLPEKIELSDAEGRIAPMSLFQAVVPAASLILTAGGLLDAWHGTDDIRESCLRVNWPDSQSRTYRNPAATVEHCALLPSILTALKLTGRLYLEECRLGTETPKMDLACDCTEQIATVFELDGLKGFDDRVERQLGKLLLLVIDLGLSLPHHEGTLPNWWKAMDALVQRIKRSAGEAGLAREDLSKIVSELIANVERLSLHGAMPRRDSSSSSETDLPPPHRPPWI